MVKIRLMRVGKKNDPVYKIVAIESTKPRGGGALDVLGLWHPREDSLEIDKKGVKDWVNKGAQVTEAVSKLLEK